MAGTSIKYIDTCVGYTSPIITHGTTKYPITEAAVNTIILATGSHVTFGTSPSSIQANLKNMYVPSTTIEMPHPTPVKWIFIVLLR